MARKRFTHTGKLVASSNSFRNIIGKRLDVSVRYVTGGLYNQTISQKVIGIRTDM